MTKQFTARAIEILGVPLDEPVFRNITVRQLLSHTSGLIDYEELITGTEQVSDHDVLRLLEQTERTYFEPGTPLDYGWHHGPGIVWHEGETVSFRNVIVRAEAARTTTIVL